MRSFTNGRGMLATASALALAAGVVACGSDSGGGASSSGSGGGGGGGDVKLGLITKTETNPFFVKMKEGADAKAKEVGAELQSFAGKKDGDLLTAASGRFDAFITMDRSIQWQQRVSAFDLDPIKVVRAAARLGPVGVRSDEVPLDAGEGGDMDVHRIPRNQIAVGRRAAADDVVAPRRCKFHPQPVVPIT